MADDISHPLRNVQIFVYGGVEGNETPQFIAKFAPFTAYPIYFSGNTPAEARRQAQDFADEAVAKHEEAYRARVIAAAARKAKKDATT